MRQTRMTGVLAGLFFAVAAGNAVPAGAAEIRVLSAGAVKAATMFLAFLQTPSSRATFKQIGLDYTE